MAINQWEDDTRKEEPETPDVEKEYQDENIDNENISDDTELGQEEETEDKTPTPRLRQKSYRLDTYDEPSFFNIFRIVPLIIGLGITFWVGWLVLGQVQEALQTDTMNVTSNTSLSSISNIFSSSAFGFVAFGMIIIIMFGILKIYLE